MRVTDARLEERHQQWNWLSFHLHTILASPWSIVREVWGYAPWLLPFRMGRLTAAAAVSLVFLLLGAEAWEVGINFSPLLLIIGALAIVIFAASFIYWGQNLSQVARHTGWREQLTRTRIVLFTTLLVGMGALWLVLFAVALGAASVLPRDVPTGWVGQSLGLAALSRYAAFLAIIGVAAGALGGNLEDADTLKTELYFDEET
jgi:glucan phosphoethanolaminetransferase (alkaline phosphatase superfamily)